MNASNMVTLMGRLTRDPEVRYSQNQTAMCSFSLGVDRRSKEKATDFPTCIAYGKTAEIIGKYGYKGGRIQVAGSLQTGSYEDRNGRKVYTTDVNVESVSIIDFNHEVKETPPRDRADDFQKVDDMNEELPF